VLLGPVHTPPGHVLPHPTTVELLCQCHIPLNALADVPMVGVVPEGGEGTDVAGRYELGVRDGPNSGVGGCGAADDAEGQDEGAADEGAALGLGEDPG